MFRPATSFGLSWFFFLGGTVRLPRLIGLSNGFKKKQNNFFFVIFFGHGERCCASHYCVCVLCSREREKNMYTRFLFTNERLLQITKNKKPWI